MSRPEVRGMVDMTDTARGVARIRWEDGTSEEIETAALVLDCGCECQRWVDPEIGWRMIGVQFVTGRPLGLLDAVPTPSCRNLTGHNVVRGCEPLGAEIKRVYEDAAPAMLEEIAEIMRPMMARAIDAGLLPPAPPAGLVEPRVPVTLAPKPTPSRT